MMVYVNGSDISRLVLGALRNDRSGFLVGPMVVPASPETFLAHIDTFLQGECAEHAATLTGIVAVLGPGSATALRTSLTLVNMLAFAKRIPVFGVQLAEGADDRSVLVALHGAAAVPLARPEYANPVNIIPRSKDALGRR